MLRMAAKMEAHAYEIKKRRTELERTNLRKE